MTDQYEAFDIKDCMMDQLEVATAMRKNNSNTHTNELRGDYSGQQNSVQELNCNFDSQDNNVQSQQSQSDNNSQSQSL